MGHYNKTAFYTNPGVRLSDGTTIPQAEEIRDNWERINNMDGAKEMAPGELLGMVLGS